MEMQIKPLFRKTISAEGSVATQQLRPALTEITDNRQNKKHMSIQKSANKLIKKATIKQRQHNLT